MKTLHETLALVHDMHQGVADWSGMPYVTHPIWVMMNLPASCIDEDRHIALMHDMIEDCQNRLIVRFEISKEYADEATKLDAIFNALMMNGYTHYIVQGLKLLTRDLWADLTYLNYVRNIIKSGHQGAMWVKYTDNVHNMDPLRRTLLSPEHRERAIQMEARYERSKKLLREGLNVSS
jgi:(p)ppGpp synthase/HD superfamily hydrolase